MASNIDVNVPTPVRATTKSVRENFVAAKDEIEALQTNEANLTTDVEAEKIRNDDQDQRLDTLEAGGGIDLTPLEDRVTVNEGDIAANTADIAVEAQAREAADDALDIRIDNLSASGGYDDTQVKADIADLDDRVTVNEGDIATNVADIAGLDGKVTVNEGDISKLKTDVGKNKSDISDNKALIDDLAAASGVPEPDAVKKPELADVALVRETNVISNPNYDSLDPDSEEFLNSGNWRTLTTGDIDTDPTTTFSFDPNNPEYTGLDTQLLVNRFLAVKADNSVKKDGDIMTGALEVQDIVTADELHTVKMDTGQNSNMSIQRRGDTKLLLAADETLAYQPLKYNANYNLDHERHLITKGYVDDAIADISVDSTSGDYVKKEGGDSMEGPFNISTQPGEGARESRRINTLGIYSNTENSSLQLGTTNTKIYVGNSDTSFNGPIKISEIQDRGNGVKVEAPLKFGQQSQLFKIETDSGTTQNIDLFGTNTNSELTTLKFNIQGATFKNAIEFESGSSTGKETILRLDSNRGIKARNLSMDDTRITHLDDPTQQTDAVNLRTLEGKVGGFAKISGDEFEGPIFGPSITNLMEGKGEYLLKLAANPSDNIHDNTNNVDDDVVMVQSRTSETEIDPGVTNRLKVRLNEDVSKYCNSTDVTYALVQPTTGAVQIWQCSNSGVGGGGSNYILNVVAETTEGDWLDPDEPVVLYRSDLAVSPYATFDMLKKYMDNVGIEIVNDSRALSLNNEDAIYSIKEGMTDLVTPRLEVATEDATTTIETMHEHSYPLFPDKDDPYYYLVPQRFVLLSRMFEGTIDGDDPKENIFCDDYSLDLWKNVIILDVKTGKTHDLPNCIMNGAQGLIYPALRGSHVITHSNGSCDVYLWISNPLRTVNYSQWGNEAAPLYRIHIPPHDQINDSDPFKNVVAKWTAIKPNKALFTFPDKNPFGNFTDEAKQFKYEVQSDTIKLKDSKTGKMHYFFRSGTKGATDFATFRLFEFIPDVIGDNPDIGMIIPVGAHPESTWGEYASGPHLIKEDTNGVQRCFMFSHPIGLTELYFVDDGAGRKPELRNYGDYTPEGTRVEDPVKKNALGRPRIVGKGILDNWYKGDQSAPQWLNHHVMDNKDRLSCTFVWFQFGYGICSLNLQDLGVIDRSNEVRLENNYKGNLNCLHIENRSQSYWGYIQESSIKNLQRFNQRTPDTHSNGSVWFFDYKTGMIADNESYYNDTRVYDNGGNRMSWRQYCRGAIEVRVNPIDSDIEIIGHDVGSETNDGEDSTDLGFSGEGITKMYDMFVLTAAGKSSSSVAEPKVFMFNPLTKSLSIVDNRETSATSLIPMPTYGVIACSCYGKKTDGTPGPIHMIEMLPEASISRIRKDATVLRKVYSVTGDSVEDDPNTWALDEPSDEPDTKQTETLDYSDDFYEE